MPDTKKYYEREDIIRTMLNMNAIGSSRSLIESARDGIAVSGPETGRNDGEDFVNENDEPEKADIVITVNISKYCWKCRFCVGYPDHHCVLDEQMRSIVANEERPDWCPINAGITAARKRRPKRKIVRVTPERYAEILESVKKNPLYSPGRIKDRIKYYDVVNRSVTDE